MATGHKISGFGGRKLNGLTLRWKIVLLLGLLLVPTTVMGLSYVFITVKNLQVSTALSGLMNFVDSKQQGIIRFLGQNEKLAKQLAQLVEDAPASVAQRQFATIVKTDIFKPEDHKFNDEIKYGTRKIATWAVYHAIDFVRDGVIEFSSNPARIGRKIETSPNIERGYSDVYMDGDVPILSFGASANGGIVYVHANAGMLTLITNGEIGNLEGDMGAYYLAGVGKTFDYYIVNENNMMITQSRAYPDSLLKRKGSLFPWMMTMGRASELGISSLADGTYNTNAGHFTGIMEAMGFYTGHNGKEMLGVSMPFYDSGWTIVVEQEASELLAPLYSVVYKTIIATAAILIFIFWAGFYFATSISLPLTDIISDISRLMDKNTKISANEKNRKDEIGDLANALEAFRKNILEKNEAQLRADRAHELLVNTIEYMPTMMVLFDADEKFVMCNQAYRETLSMVEDLLIPGVTFEEISRVGAERGFVGEYRDNPEEWVRVRLARFRNPGDPVIHRQIDGRWVMTADHRFPDGSTLITRTDVTPVMKAEEEARSKEATLHAFLDAMDDLAAMVDTNENFVFANQAMANAFGVSPQSLVGKPMFKTPATEIGKQRRQWIRSVVETGEPVRKIEEYEGKWHDSRFTPVFDSNGKVAQIAIVARDITNDINKESLLRKMSLAMEQSADIIFIADRNGIIEHVNRKFTESTGYTADEAIGRNPSMLKSSETPDEVYKELWDTILSGKTWRGELRDKRKDGSLLWAGATITPIFDDSGNITNFVSSHVDIAERKATEEAMQGALLQTEVANRAKSELLANMSHELRTPLNAIIGFSSMMVGEVYGKIGNDKYEEYSEIINNSANHLLEMINDVLDVSAIEAGKLKLYEEEFSVSDSILSTMHLVEQRAEDGGVSVNSSIDTGNDVLFADKRRFKQILINLLSNAIKFTLEGGTVKIEYTVNDSGHPLLRVSDTGIGMDAKDLDIAFSQFGQADSGLARKHEGTGLGLPLTKGLVEMHGGTIDVQSAKGKGTTVTVIFPPQRCANTTNSTPT